jgi:hypothetical protein
MAYRRPPAGGRLSGEQEAPVQDSLKLRAAGSTSFNRAVAHDRSIYQFMLI